MRAQFVPVDGGPPVEIVKDLTIVGRKEECDLRLDHKSISKMHCVIVKTDGLLLLRDLGSTNGTRVNGQRIRRAALLPNDKVTFANFTFKVQFGDALPAAPPGEHTQHLNADEVARLLAPANSAEPRGMDSSIEMPIMPPQAKDLPDIYPENEQKPKAR
jgi:pSer/pThr/pTyr-binding forkhead associated (FHA) protein